MIGILEWYMNGTVKQSRVMMAGPRELTMEAGGRTTGQAMVRDTTPGEMLTMMDPTGPDIVKATTTDLTLAAGGLEAPDLRISLGTQRGIAVVGTHRSQGQADRMHGMNVLVATTPRTGQRVPYVQQPTHGVKVLVDPVCS